MKYGETSLSSYAIHVTFLFFGNVTTSNPQCRDIGARETREYSDFGVMTPASQCRDIDSICPVLTRISLN
ncbi:hypothetical protein J1N35_000007 [Gossypium stocksii]|uniref:Uncharacterized protein n=1 Tax=Gossypium stocksii TaxID=47602 RepID=A0A9D4AKG4_9ROSI|nr:hypothetical protein J1N35_000007 [Gossypium stocksii]